MLRIFYSKRSSLIIHGNDRCEPGRIWRCALVGLFVLGVLFPMFNALAQSPPVFRAAPLTDKGDLSALMIEGIDRFLTAQQQQVTTDRTSKWTPDYTNSEAFNKSIAANRALLARITGAVDERIDPALEILTDRMLKPVHVGTKECTISAVRWTVMEGFTAEGLLLRPSKKKIVARGVVIPDADVLPEVLAGIGESQGSGYGVARRLAEAGWEVLVPVLVSRDEVYSGSESMGRFTNQPHREWIYRQGYVLGRHVIGYELQKILSAVDWLDQRNKAEGISSGVGVAGHGEGGLLALFAAAMDVRIASALVSGYFNNRDGLWREPIYRNLHGFLKTFADAELAVMTWPRRLVIEHANGPQIEGPPSPSKGRTGAAPGSLTSPDFFSARAEWDRATEMLPANKIHLTWHSDGEQSFKQPFSTDALNDFARGLNMAAFEKSFRLVPVRETREWPDAEERQERIVRGMQQHVQSTLAQCEKIRDETFWKTLNSDTISQEKVKELHRDRFRDVIGILPTPSMPANAQARMLEKTDKWTSYEVKLDVWTDVFAWGILLIPNDISPGQKRPVVVCQHGLEGLPVDAVVTDSTVSAFRYYKGFAARLAERGYVTFAPHNPYRGEDNFRVLQRKANPLGLSLFSVMTGQHQRIVEWLASLTFVDSKRIGFYGLSYGGKAAMRIPVLVEGYALSICSGDFNEWVRKVASTDEYDFVSYPYTKEYEIPEWDLGHTFNYAEMAALIAPRPFMVERGHSDGVGTDEWVSFEFAKVRRHYDLIGLSRSREIEYFNGGHTINGKGTFDFLDRHLKRP